METEGKEGEDDEEMILSELATEFKEIEKEIQWYKYWDKKLGKE